MRTHIIALCSITAATIYAGTAGAQSASRPSLGSVIEVTAGAGVFSYRYTESRNVGTVYAAVAHHFGSFVVAEGDVSYAATHDDATSPAVGPIAHVAPPVTTGSLSLQAQLPTSYGAPYLGVGRGIFRRSAHADPRERDYTTWVALGSRIGVAKGFALRPEVRLRDDGTVPGRSKRIDSTEWRLGLVRGW